MVTLQRSRFGLLIVLVAGAAFLAGCNGGDSGGDPNYTTTVNMTPEQKSQQEEEMKRRPAPGTAPKLGEPRAEPSAGLQLPKGKH